jgi:transposase InsO family protein
MNEQIVTSRRITARVAIHRHHAGRNHRGKLHIETFVLGCWLPAILRRLGLLLKREGLAPNHKKLRRIYAEERLQVRRRGGRKRALGTRRPIAVPDGSNQRWSLDFVSDTRTDGRRFRVLCVVDDFTRECLTLVADTSLSGRRVVRERDAITARRGYPLSVSARSAPCSGAGNMRRFC